MPGKKTRPAAKTRKNLERGKTYTTEAGLRAAVVAYVHAQPILRSDRQMDDEREARAIVGRLRAALRDAEQFAATRTGKGPMADWLRLYDPLRLAPLRELPALQEGVTLPELPKENAALSTIVEWWAEAHPQPSDRDLALTALSVGWWPERAVSLRGATVARVIDLTRRAVKELRKGSSLDGPVPVVRAPGGSMMRSMTLRSATPRPALPPSAPTPIVVTDRTAPELLGLTPRSYREWLRAAGIPHATICRRTVARVEHIVDAIDRLSGAEPRPTWSEDAASVGLRGAR